MDNEFYEDLPPIESTQAAASTPAAAVGAALPPVRSALELYHTPPDEGATLIGDRFLCRGGGLVLAGPSGVGKSTFTAGFCVAMARGESYLHILPSGPLKVLVIQAENDDGDLNEQLRGAIGELMEGDEETFTKRLKFVTIDFLSGTAFLNNAVAGYLAEERPDLLVIDCLSSYLGDSATEQAALIEFLRNGLTSLIRKFNCGCMLIHHTPKTTNQNRAGWNASDMQYAMAGGADVANWMRSGLLIEATKDPHLFRLHAMKRGKRLGWHDAEDKSTSMKLIRHAAPDQGLRWEVADGFDVERLKEVEIPVTESKKRVRLPEEAEVLDMFPQEAEGSDPEKWLMTTAALKWRFKEVGLSKDDLSGIMERLVSIGEVVLIEKPRGRKDYALRDIAEEYHKAKLPRPGPRPEGTNNGEQSELSELSECHSDGSSGAESAQKPEGNEEVTNDNQNELSELSPDSSDSSEKT